MDLTVELSHLYKIIRDKGIGLFIEDDKKFNSFTQYNYDISHRQRPQQLIVDIIIQLYKFIYDTDTPFNYNYEYYKSTICQTLIDRAAQILTENHLKSLVCSEDEGSDSSSCVHNIKQFLSNKTPNKKSDTFGLYLLTIIQQQIWEYIPFAFSKKLNNDYGRSLVDPEYILPIIYNNGTPLDGAEFSNMWEFVNLTCIMYISNGIINNTQATLIIKRVKRFRDGIIKEENKHNVWNR
eukprot:GHVR01100946.1.p1 GENE.GHVR01100946.1~~GHVR01100946.1.p1  ORF type:complete len:257 (-),score=41.49 GHVR01100946.1:258-968(-)